MPSSSRAASTRIARQSDVSIEGKDIVVVQTKADRLGMYLMGQAFFSAQLMKPFLPRSVESVALVAQDDSVLRPLLEQYQGMRVVVCPKEVSNQVPRPSGEDCPPGPAVIAEEADGAADYSVRPNRQAGRAKPHAQARLLLPAAARGVVVRDDVHARAGARPVRLGPRAGRSGTPTWPLGPALQQLRPRPAPVLVTLWGGPVLGAVLPLAAALLVRRQWVWFIAYFCLLANGLYLAAAWASGERFLDTPGCWSTAAHPGPSQRTAC